MLRVGTRIGVAGIGLIVVLTCLVPRNAMATDNDICNVAADRSLGVEDYPKAIASHLELVRSEPNNALAHYHLGFAYGMVGRVNEELAEYRTASQLGLKNWDLFLNLGLAYLGQRELAPATEALETAARLGPEHFEAHYNLALAYESERRPAEALREIEVSRRLAPDDSDAANANAIICVENGNTACAQEIWSQLVRLAPDYAPAGENLSILNRSVAMAKLSRLNGLRQNDDSLNSSAVDALPEIARSSGIWSK
jgi:tetratricopeptide (TPR) repeat protein